LGVDREGEEGESEGKGKSAGEATHGSGGAVASSVRALPTCRLWKGSIGGVDAWRCGNRRAQMPRTWIVCPGLCVEKIPRRHGHLFLRCRYE
jgi:hypothetical protein